MLECLRSKGSDHYYLRAWFHKPGTRPDRKSLIGQLYFSKLKKADDWCRGGGGVSVTLYAAPQGMLALTDN